MYFVGTSNDREHSDISLRIIHNICNIKLTLKYFSYIHISYQMYKTWSNCISTTVFVFAENDLASSIIWPVWLNG